MNFMNIRHFLHFLLLCITLQACNSSNTSTTITYATYQFSCCEIWEMMDKFTTEKSGGIFNINLCNQSPMQCLETKLIANFLEQTKVLAGSTNLQVENQIITITMHTFPVENFMQALVWAYIGRAVTQQNDNTEAQFKLVYDVNKNELSVKRSACEFSKSIYSSMVIASICILIFLISMQILEQYKTQQTIHNLKTPTNIDKKPDVTLAEVSMKRMRLPFSLTSDRLYSNY